MSFAGATWYAYPLFLQVVRSIEFYPSSLNRRTDLTVVKGQTLRIFNQMRSLIHDFPVGEDGPGNPETVFIFGGFSWRFQKFLLWKLHFDERIDGFTFRPIHEWLAQEGRKLVTFAGDAEDEAKERLIYLLKSRNKLPVGDLDMEPFEVLRDIIRGGHYPSIGGPPQVGKVYRYMRTQHFAVRWPDNEGRPHALGRPALDYEIFDAPTINPDGPPWHPRHAVADGGPLLDSSAWESLGDDE